MMSVSSVDAAGRPLAGGRYMQDWQDCFLVNMQAVAIVA